MRGRSKSDFYKMKVVEYTLLRHTSITYRDLAVMPERDVWRYYAMYSEEQKQESEERRKAERRAQTSKNVHWN